MLTQILLKRIGPFLLAATLGFAVGSFRGQSPESGSEGVPTTPCSDAGNGSAWDSPPGTDDSAGNSYRESRIGVAGKVTFLSKPKATYTDEARNNAVKGKVTLRVALLADGTIGPITVIKRLPLGLTEQAIAAARQIKFQPATINGVPVSKVVTVQYAFYIY